MKEKKLLQLYMEAGVDEIISETPVNRLLPGLPRRQEAPVGGDVSTNAASKITTFDAISKLATRANNQQTNNMSQQPLVSIAEIVAKARATADSCKNLKDLEKAVKNFDGCSLKKMATNTVFADGDSASQIMIIGEAPGNHEDLQGIPFCGDSGKLLNEMFKAIGFKRENLYITNTLFWRPPGNRRPTEDELAMCKPFVEKHIALMKPKLIVLMGATAMADVLKIHEPISKMCGKFFDYKNDYLKTPIKTTVLFHPSYLMRQSSKKREAWLDLLLIKEFLGK
jgi:uracil-DNA glycosylase family 4